MSHFRDVGFSGMDNLGFVISTSSNPGYIGTLTSSKKIAVE